jgi:hypothetical protein
MKKFKIVWLKTNISEYSLRDRESIELCLWSFSRVGINQDGTSAFFSCWTVGGFKIWKPHVCTVVVMRIWFSIHERIRGSANKQIVLIGRKRFALTLEKAQRCTLVELLFTNSCKYRVIFFFCIVLSPRPCLVDWKFDFLTLRTPVAHCSTFRFFVVNIVQSWTN